MKTPTFIIFSLGLGLVDLMVGALDDTSRDGLRNLQGGPDSDTPAGDASCTDETGRAFGICVAYCGAQECDKEDDPLPRNCERLAANYLEETGEELSCFCFPKDVSVEVEGKGSITMEHLQLGDKVRTLHGFSQVYAFGTRTVERGKKNTFVKLITHSFRSLELSAGHVVFTGDKMKPKFASEIKIGDELMFMPEKELHKVAAVQNVKREGAFHPLTHDGSIIVNGIAASIHAVDSDVFAPVASIRGFHLLDKQQFQQVILTPLRLLCTISAENFCGNQNHWQDGTHHLFEMIENLVVFLMPESMGSPQGEANFLLPTVFLPFKLLVLTWALALYAIEAIIAKHHTLLVPGIIVLAIIYKYHAGRHRGDIHFCVTTKKKE